MVVNNKQTLILKANQSESVKIDLVNYTPEEARKGRKKRNDLCGYTYL